MKLDDHATIGRNPEVVIRQLEDGAVLLDTQTGRYYRINETGRTIWDILEDRHPTLADIVQGVQERFNGTLDNVTDDVREFVESLVSRDLASLEEPPKPSPSLADESHRDPVSAP